MARRYHIEISTYEDDLKTSVDIITVDQAAYNRMMYALLNKDWQPESSISPEFIQGA